jgi:tetratricopeptide (TPR) repeat protein
MRFSQKQIILLISAALVITTLIAYEPIRHNGFVNYDDNKYITENPSITGGLSWQSLGQAFTQPHFFMWHPLTTISHMLDYQLFGLNPLGHHLISLLIHIVNTLLLFWILKNTTGTIWASAFVAAVFALHPIQVESVAWAAERKTVLSGLFWMLTMAAYIHYAKRPGAGRYFLVLLMFGLCIMTKPTVVALPLALLLLDYWPLDRIRWGQQAKTKSNQKSAGWLIAEKIPLLAMSAFLAVITYITQKSGGVIETLGTIPLNYRIANMFLSYIAYIGKMLWPSGLAICYPHQLATLSSAPVVMCAMLFIALTVLSIYTGRRKKYAAVGWLWYVGTLVPMIGLVQAGEQAMANRYMYISMLGLLIIITCAANDFIAGRLRLKIVAAILAMVLLSVLIILTRIQVGHWQNSITLYDYALKVTQNNALVENNYGITLLIEEGRLNEAEQHFKNAIRIRPTYEDARNNLGRVLLMQGKTDEAIACFNELLRQNENFTQAQYYLAMALGSQGKYNDAIKHFAMVPNSNPKYPDARYRMGLALMTTNRFNEAITCFYDSLRQNGDSADIHYNLAIALGTQKKYDEAIEHLSKVLQLNPMYPGAHNKIGLALQSAGRLDEAIKYLNEGLKINRDPETYANLGSAYIQAGRYDLAVENLTKALELKPYRIDVLNKLAWLYAVVDDTSIHNVQKAVEFAQRGCELTGYKDPVLLDTLAIAYAAAGRFDEAKATAEKALNIAKETGRDKLVVAIQERLTLYEAGQPYRAK